ncbi:MAG: soluble lytic murein transglycosylase and like regulatory protein [Clostridiaceae bacterium]|jgi:hypothetical protein|nr:soluble lytic murein transglycosylase and like regulatory protein [Clostridiaceae bacterium]
MDRQHLKEQKLLSKRIVEKFLSERINQGRNISKGLIVTASFVFCLIVVFSAFTGKEAKEINIKNFYVEEFKNTEILSLNAIKEQALEFEKNEKEDIYNENIPMPREHQEYLYELCKERGLDYKITLAVLKHESQFDANVIADRDYGYMQINLINHKYLSELLGTANKPLDPYININWGTYMLSDLYEYWESNGLTGKELEESVLSSYNKGITGYKRGGKAMVYLEKIENEKTFIYQAFNTAY